MNDCAEGGFAQRVLGSLLDRRTVMVTGALDNERATDLAATLLALDALGDERIDLRLDCPAASLVAAGALVDVFDIIGVPVHTTCYGLVGGGAVGILAAAHQRRITRHGRLRLTQPVTDMTGSARELDRWATVHREQWERFLARVAADTGRPEAALADVFARGVFLDAPGALEWGLVDEIVS